MCRRSLRMLLLAVGCLLLSASVFPVFVFLHMGEPLQTALVGSKLLMLPVGAVCLLGASGLQQKHR
jgi:hypothetical protein